MPFDSNTAKPLEEAGNINLSDRPRVKNADGSVSTVRSISINADGKEILIPTVSEDGRIMSDQEAIQQYKTTGRNLGKFNTPAEATAYAKTLSQEQGKKLQFDPSTAQILPDPSRPAGTMPEWLSDLGKYGPGFLAEQGRKGLASGMRGWDSLSETFSKLPTVPGMLTKVMRGNMVPLEETAKKVDVPLQPGASDSDKFLDKTVRGAGAAAMMPLSLPKAGTAGIFVPGENAVRNVLPGAVGGATGEALRRPAEKVDPRLGPYGELLGNIFGGMATGYALGPKQSVAQADLRRGMEGLGPEDFKAAQANAAEAGRNGAKTFTAAEAFPENSAVMSMAREAQGGNADNALRARTENRKADLLGLGDRFRENIGPNVDGNQVANNAAASADAVLAGQKATRGNLTRSTMAGQNLTDRQVVGMYSDLHNLAQSSSSPSLRSAYEEVASALQNADGGPQLNVQELSLALKRMRSAAQNPNSPTPASGRVFDKVDMNQALGSADAMLRERSPQYGQAMDQYGQFTEQVMDPTRKGPIGSLSNRNPLLAGQAPISRFDALVSGNSPTIVRDTVERINSPLLTGHQTTSPESIARAMADKALHGGSTNPGLTMRGEQGSPKENAFSAILEAAGQNPSETLSPLRTADRMQQLGNPSGINEAPRMRLSNWIRPFRALDMAMTWKSQRAVNDEVARLLADPNNIPELQKIAMFNPQLRAALTARGAMLPLVMQNSQEK